MKKSISYLGVLLFLMMMPMVVLAAGSITVSTRSLSITTGNSKSFSIIANNACGYISVSSSNPNVATVSLSSDWVENGSVNAVVVGKSAGSATITVTLNDAATFDEEVLNGSYTISVSVTDPAPTPPPTPTPTPNPTQPQNPSSVNPITGNDNRSSNANLKSLSVENFEITKVDDTHYSLEVKHSIDKIKILATAEDAKATVKGTGEVALTVGDNSFDIVVTAENGTTKTYALKVVRRDNQYSLDKIDDALKDTDEISITLKENDTITKDVLGKIQDLKKKVEFVRYDDNKKVLYTLVVDGSKLKHNEDIKTNVQFSFTNAKAFDELSGYRKGVCVQFLEQSKFPSGVSLIVPVEYQDGDKVQLYTYNKDKNKIELLQKNVKVESGSVKMSLKDASSYFITKAFIEEADVGSYKIVAIVEFILLLAMTGAIFVFCFQKKKTNNIEVLR